MDQQPVRVAIANDYEIVVAGIAAVLEPHTDRIEVVELVVGEEPHEHVDVVLYDTFGQAQGAGIDLDRFSMHGTAKLVAFSWNTQTSLIKSTLQLGLAGYISKAVTADQLVDALVQVAAGERVVLTPSGNDDFGKWPGIEVQLTAREAEVLALITQGLSNNEICEQIYVTLNTLKSYIRKLYRKIEVESRAQAVRWGMENGFSPDEVLHETPPL